MGERIKDIFMGIGFLVLLFGCLYFVYTDSEKRKIEDEKEKFAREYIEVNGTVTPQQKFSYVRGDHHGFTATSGINIFVQCPQSLDVQTYNSFAFVYTNGKWFMDRGLTNKVSQEQAKNYINSCVPLFDVEYEKTRLEKKNLDAKENANKQSWGVK